MDHFQIIQPIDLHAHGNERESLYFTLGLQKDDMGVAWWIGLVGIAHHSIQIKRDGRLRKQERRTNIQTKDGYSCFPVSSSSSSYTNRKRPNPTGHQIIRVNNDIDPLIVM